MMCSGSSWSEWKRLASSWARIVSTFWALCVSPLNMVPHLPRATASRGQLGAACQSI